MCLQAGYYCSVCDCILRDSQSYLDHINGKWHNRALGMSMRVERSNADQVCCSSHSKSGRDLLVDAGKGIFCQRWSSIQFLERLMKGVESSCENDFLLVSGLFDRCYADQLWVLRYLLLNVQVRKRFDAMKQNKYSSEPSDYVADGQFSSAPCPCLNDSFAWTLCFFIAFYHCPSRPVFGKGLRLHSFLKNC